MIIKLQHVEYADGEIIFSQGDQGDRFYIVTSGQVGVLKRMEVDDDHGTRSQQPTKRCFNTCRVDKANLLSHRVGSVVVLALHPKLS